MRILNLRFKNINSLKGDWEIDFTDNAYAASGLFAITGPTGAGKSTILDAISLALYGRTPRLENVSAGENELMSRHTGECSAEVMFENQKGRFICRWYQHRARTKADGRLQTPRHEITNVADGRPMTEKMKETVQKVIEITGMDFNQFTRSVLLAQGEFSKFLKAKTDDRSAMLEKITGTAIYSDISIAVHERHRAENEKLEKLKAAMDGITLLTEEERQKLFQDRSAFEARQQELKPQIGSIQTAITGLETIERLTEELGDIAQAKQTLTQQVADFAPQKAQLDWAVKAETLSAEFATLESVRKQYQGFIDQLKKLENALPDLQTAEQTAKQTAETAQTAVTQAKDTQQAGSQAITQMRLLDQKIAGLSKGVETCRDDLKTLQEKQAEANTKQSEKQAKQAQKTSEITTNTQWLEEHRADEWLVAHFEAVRQQLEGLADQAKTIKDSQSVAVQAGEAVETTEAAWKKAQGATASKQTEAETITARMAENQKAVVDLLNGQEKTAYEHRLNELQTSQNMAKVVASLTDHRARLKDGEPCPCCGATEHPFAQGNLPKPDQYDADISRLTALLSAYDRFQGEISRLQQKAVPAQNALTEAKLSEAQSKSEYEQAAAKLADAEQAVKDHQTAYAGQKATIIQHLAPLGISGIPENPQTLVRQLEKRLKDWNTHQNSKAMLEQQLSQINTELSGLKASVSAADEAVKTAAQKLGEEKTVLKTEQDKRKAQYGDRNPDTEEQRLAEAVKNAESEAIKAKETHDRTVTELNANKTQQESLIGQRDQAWSEREQKQQAFNQLLAEKGFADEQAWKDICLPETERLALQTASDTLSKRQIELDTQQKSKQSELTEVQAAHTATEPLETLRQKKNTMEVENTGLTEKLAEIRTRLKADDECRQSAEEQQRKVDAQQAVTVGWDKLRVLIGSADGKKFRNFAQGLTFEIMVNHANQQLIEMNGRYLLQRDREEPLNLCVQDNWQGGEIRSVTNLSGGESFIISLALALGLSKMASRNTRIDSFFLDEGFGTLDEETLNTAIETLSGLHEEGKLIGVISHIPLVKERIATQIEVIKGKGGVSHLKGPGIAFS